MTKKISRQGAIENVNWWLNEALGAFKEGDLEDFEHCLEEASKRANREVGE